MAEDTPVAFGCAAEKDRTGVVAALLQTLLGGSVAAYLVSNGLPAQAPERLREALVSSG